MATIQSTITLIDGVSNVLSGISNQLGQTQRDFEQLESSAVQAQR